MIAKSSTRIFFTCFLLWSSISFAQVAKERGFPLITNYSFKEYKAEGQNWAILQGANGKMYFGNNLGLLEYDGIAWRLYQVPNKSTIRSLALGDSSKIYAGATGELGFFQPNQAGQLIFHSLMEHLPADKKDLGDVWDAFVIDNKVYFNAANYLLIWNIQQQEFRIISSEKGFHSIFKANETLYIREWEKGLSIVRGDSIVLVKGGEAFAQERIYVILPFPSEKGSLLIVTRTMGLFKYDGHQFTPFKTEADQFIKDKQIYQPGNLLQDSTFLLGTIGGGAVVIDRQGKVQQYFNTTNGIGDNDISYSFQDKDGNIWLATSNGITSIEYRSLATYFDNRNQLSTTILDLIRHQGKIYAAGNSGLYYLDPQTSHFQRVKNSISNQYYALLNRGNTLLVGGNEGLSRIDKDELLPIRKSIGNEYNVHVLTPSRLYPERVFVGAYGLWSVRQNDNTWIDEGNILPFPDSPSGIVEMEDGSLWVSTAISGIYRVRFGKDQQGKLSVKKPAISHFSSESGLQKGLTFVTMISGVPYFKSPDSIYRFDESKQRFYSDGEDPIMAAFYKLANKKTVICFQQDSQGRLWLATKNTLAMGSPQPDGSYTWDAEKFKRFAAENIWIIYSEPNGLLWFAGLSSLIRHDFNKSQTAKNSYDAMVRGVRIGSDSTIFFGASLIQASIPQIAFADNAIQFIYAATSFEEKGKLQFQTFLEGFDKGWSAWTTEALKEYTNLAPGSYTFKVKAINTIGQESNMASYSFVILPPWYRTWWAYTLFALAFSLLAFGFVRMQQYRAVVRERQKSAIREANLKADAENERRKNIEIISEMGRDITASLSIEHIINTVYSHVNKLMDASVFGIGIYNKDKQQLEFPATKEKGQTLKAYTYRLDDASRPASWCYNNRKDIFINDYEKEYSGYVTEIGEVTEGEHSESIIYLPLLYKDKAIGVITAQSFSKNAYNEYHLNVLRSLATYTSVALDNADAYRHLQATQNQLIQKEKLASLGELTAGIAHEIQNPLNFVNNFSELSVDLVKDLKDELKRPDKDEAYIDELFDDLSQNQEKINHHGKRASSIVKGMLEHSRASTGERALTDINALADEYLRLSYHGLRAKDKSFNADYKTDFEPPLSKISIVPQDMGRVLLNLYNNAFYAVHERKQLLNDETYTPSVIVTTKQLENAVEIRVKDNGTGMPESVRAKVFQPFFTTKPTGQGTGLGLSLAYDIVTKGHGGTMEVISKEGESTEFIIRLPL